MTSNSNKLLLVKAKIWNGEAEPTPLEGEREPWGGTRCPLEAENKKKKLEIIPKKSYKILDKRKILWYNKSR